MADRSRGIAFRRCLIAMLAGVVCLRIGAAFSGVGDTDLTVWGDRDLWRALFGPLQVLGPEINGGARPPGGAFYLLLRLLLAGNPGIAAAHAGVLVLFALSVALLALALARGSGPRAAVLGAALMAGSPILDEVLRVWNPGYILLFATVATLCGQHYLERGRALSLGVAAAALAIGSQIHLQMILPGLALLLAALIRRPGWSHRHTLALAAGLVLPFLPALAGGGFEPAAVKAAPMPGGVADNYLLGGFDPLGKLSLALALLGGPTALPTAPPPAGLIPALLGQGLAVILCGAGLAGAIGPAGRRGAMLFPLLVGLFFLIEVAASSINVRHVVAAIPALALLGARAGDRILARLEQRSSRAAGLLAGAILCLAAAPSVTQATSLLTRARPSGLTPLQAEIAATAKAAFETDPEDFDRHASLFWRQNRSWRLVQEGVDGQMAFLFRTTPAAGGIRPAGLQDGLCYAILRREEADANADGDASRNGKGQALGMELARSQPFTGLAPVFTGDIVESRHFLFLPYRTADGNCLKSFPNAYVPTGFEQTFLAEGPAAAPRKTATGVVFAVDIPGERHPVGVELRAPGNRTAGEGLRLRAVLQGRLLRGYTGLRFLTLIDPVLCLEGDAGIRTVPLGRQTVGSPQKGTLAPWFSPDFALADGDYRLWLTARDGKSPLVLAAPLGRLSLPDMSVSPPPAGATGEAPPAGCAAPATTAPPR
ncbi:MAG: hypothetical protein F8N37_15720 [Telmatospirillum sp.]|nr:hypothetical protein [Telmatospirillum sp.]